MPPHHVASSELFNEFRRSAGEYISTLKFELEATTGDGENAIGTINRMLATPHVLGG